MDTTFNNSLSLFWREKIMFEILAGALLNLDRYTQQFLNSSVSLSTKQIRALQKVLQKLEGSLAKFRSILEQMTPSDQQETQATEQSV